MSAEVKGEKQQPAKENLPFIPGRKKQKKVPPTLAKFEASLLQRPDIIITLYKILKHRCFESTFTLIILFNLVMVIRETDAVANDEDSSVWMDVAGWAILICFTAEMALRLIVFRCEFWGDRLNAIEFALVAIDFVMNVISLFGSSYSVSFLRIVRLCKLARVGKVFKLFPELRLMMAGLLGSIRAIFWGAVMLVFFVLMWSVLAVQFIHPLNEEVDNAGKYRDCERCGRAFSSVFQSCLTFSQQIVAGDAWGTPTVTLIEQYPATGIFFAAVFVTVGLAALNLILGVVVEVASQAREELVEEIEDESILEAMELSTNLLDVFKSLDEDGNGEVTKAELLGAYRTNDLFRETITSMDLTEDDVNIIWIVLDSDRSGTISYTEFVTNVFKMKCSATSFMLAYVKFYVTEIKNKICEQVETTKDELIRVHTATGGVDSRGLLSMNEVEQELHPAMESDLFIEQEPRPTGVLVGKDESFVATKTMQSRECAIEMAMLAENIRKLAESLQTEILAEDRLVPKYPVKTHNRGMLQEKNVNVANNRDSAGLQAQNYSFHFHSLLDSVLRQTQNTFAHLQSEHRVYQQHMSGMVKI